MSVTLLLVAVTLLATTTARVQLATFCKEKSIAQVK